MRIIKVFPVFAAALLALAACSQKPDYRVCAFIWPSCHDDSLAHELLWPEGIGEWEIINAATPHFEGHQQPKHPLWGVRWTTTRWFLKGGSRLRASMA